MVRLLHEQADDLAARIGAPLELVGVAVRRLDRTRDVEVDPRAAHHRRRGAGRPRRRRPRRRGDRRHRARPLADPGGAAHGASVVTANKALLAEDGATLFGAAEKAGARPLLRGRRRRRDPDAPAAARVAGRRPGHRVLGIVNGTTNFILDKMDSTGAGFAEALEEAQALGYAEADPTADVEGFDAAAKAAILAGLAFHTRVTAADVHREGITEVTAADVARPEAMGCVVKLLAICELRQADGDGRRSCVRVHPAMIPRSHPLAGVREAYNAVFVEAEVGRPADVLRPGRRRCADRLRGARRPGDGGPQPARAAPAARGSRRTPTGPSARWARRVTRYHVSLDVADRPACWPRSPTVFAKHDVSIQTVRQEGRGDDAQLVVVTHRAHDAALSATVGRCGPCRRCVRWPA